MSPPNILVVVSVVALALVGGVAFAFSVFVIRALASLLAAFVVYLAGSVGVTMAFNVARNNRLASLEAASAQAAAYWPVYVREWLAWNHVRCIASLAAAALAASAIAP